MIDRGANFEKESYRFHIGKLVMAFVSRLDLTKYEPGCITRRKAGTMEAGVYNADSIGEFGFYFFSQLSNIFFRDPDDPLLSHDVVDPRNNQPKVAVRPHDAFHILASELIRYYGQVVKLNGATINGLNGSDLPVFLHAENFVQMYKPEYDEILTSLLQLKIDPTKAIFIIQYLYFYFVLLSYGVNPLEIGKLREIVSTLVERARNGETNGTDESPPSLVFTKFQPIAEQP